MQIDIIETASLGDRSYLVSADGTGVVVDPQRDIDRVQQLAAARGVVITTVLETHLHNDYVTGGLELSRAVGGEYVVPAGDDVRYERHPAHDGEVIAASPMRLRVLHTPGHTHHHVSYVLTDTDGAVQAVFTGGSMLYGATGRTDLLGDEHTRALTHAQFHSVRRLAAELPPCTPVFPTHGFGSFCSATPTSGTESTIGEQARVNPALTQDEQAFVDELISGLGAYPAYYARMGPANAAGPEPVDLSLPRRVDPAELARRIAAGEWVVDLRKRTAFAAGHLPGTLNFELSTKFLTYLGWLYDWGAPLTLIGETEDDVADARRELVRIGVDRLAGAAVGQPEELWAGGARLVRGQRLRRAGRCPARRPHVVVDARRDDERASGGVRGSVHIPIHELAGRLDEIPDGEVWVYCGSGYRASIAASMLVRAGRRPVLVDGSYDDEETGSRAQGLHVDAALSRGPRGAAAPARSGDGAPGRAAAAGRTQQAVRVPSTPRGLRGLPGLPPELGGPVAVALAKPVAAIPPRTALPGGCVYEPKWDGYRLVVVRTAASTRLWSKQGRDLTDRFPDVAAAALAQVPAGTVVDGEVVIWNGSRLDFGLLQQRMVTAVEPDRRPGRGAPRLLRRLRPAGHGRGGPAGPAALPPPRGTRAGRRPLGTADAAVAVHLRPRRGPALVRGLPGGRRGGARRQGGQHPLRARPPGVAEGEVLGDHGGARRRRDRGPREPEPARRGAVPGRRARRRRPDQPVVAHSVGRAGRRPHRRGQRPPVAGPHRHRPLRRRAPVGPPHPGGAGGGRRGQRGRRAAGRRLPPPAALRPRATRPAAGRPAAPRLTPCCPDVEHMADRGVPFPPRHAPVSPC